MAVLFGAITLYSSLRKYFTELAPTLRTLEVMGMARSLQIRSIITLLISISVLAFALSLGGVSLILSLLRQVPQASEFTFLLGPIGTTGLIMLILLVSI